MISVFIPDGGVGFKAGSEKQKAADLAANQSTSH
jgi:hypothetical protein